MHFLFHKALCPFINSLNLYIIFESLDSCYTRLQIFSGVSVENNITKARWHQWYVIVAYGGKGSGYDRILFHF